MNTPLLRRGGFTLFEVILAIALSATLLALIGTAINLYLLRIDASRNEVEEAQLARTILGIIAADLRATTVYQPQDTAAIAQLMASTAEIDVDDIDRENPDGGGAVGANNSPDEIDAPSTSGTSSTEITSPLVLPLGLSGNMQELIIDVSRLPRADELFSTVTGYTNAPSAVAGTTGAPITTMTPGAVLNRPSDVKTVRYFIRQGNQIGSGSLAATSLAPEEQLRAGGLVRQEIDRAVRTFAEESGSQAVLDAGQTLLAPEVVRIEFYFFDGTEVYDVWDMQEHGSLPLAIEVRLWLLTPDDENQQSLLPNNAMSIAANAREYRQTVYLPMSAVASSSAAAGDGASTGGAPQ